MKNSLKFTGLIMIILLSGSISANAQNVGMRGGMRDGIGAMGYVTPPLTEEQKTKLTTMTEKYHVEMDTLRSQLRRSTDIKKRGDLASKIQILSDTHKSDLKNVLTADQKISLETVNNIFAGRRGTGMMMNDSLRMAPNRGNMLQRGTMQNPLGRGNINNNFYGRGNDNRVGNMGRRR